MSIIVIYPIKATTGNASSVRYINVRIKNFLRSTRPHVFLPVKRIMPPTNHRMNSTGSNAVFITEPKRGITSLYFSSTCKHADVKSRGKNMLLRILLRQSIASPNILTIYVSKNRPCTVKMARSAIIAPWCVAG